MSTPYDQAIRQLLAGDDLPAPLATAVMEELVGGELPAGRIAALLTALAAKGESAGELAAFVRVLRARMVTVDAPPGPLLDTCGTGGSGLDTVNTSTLVALIAAAAGVRVAKHGNRSSSGKCGSADVLQALGARLELTPAEESQLLAREGLAFLFAPLHHPALRHVGPVRRELGFRTVFNFLGPLCNPAGATHQLLGVSDPVRAPLLARTLAELGTEHAMVVRGEEGLDELSLSGPSRVWEVTSGRLQEREVTPADAGLTCAPFADYAGGEPADNLRLARALLAGEETGARRDHLLFNAAAALVVAGRVTALPEGVELADELLSSGAVAAKLASYCRAVRELEQEGEARQAQQAPSGGAG